MPVTFAPATGAYRRLTSTAFQNSLRDLLGGSVTVGELEPDSWSIGGFASVSAATVSISQVGVEDYQTAIDAATTQVFADTTRRDKLLGCKPASVSDTTCFQSFVKTFGRLAWRQPLTAAQVTRYAQLIGTVASSMADAYEGMRAGHERPAAIPELPLQAGAWRRAGLGRRQPLLAVHEPRDRVPAVVLPHQLDAGRDAAGGGGQRQPHDGGCGSPAGRSAAEHDGRATNR